MPSELTLEPVASAPQTARRWIEQELEVRARSELADSAVLGVSELVTNAVLHVRSSIVVRVVDIDTRIRIEVYDHAPRPVDGHSIVVPGGRDNESTIGRGLQIVDSISYAWGVSYEHLGKCVWFNPAPDSNSHEPTEHSPPVIHGAGPSDLTTPAPKEARVTIELIDLPVQLFAYYRTKFFDLRREMALIALSSTRTDTIAHRLVQLAERLESLRDEQGRWVSQLDRALRDGLERVTVTLEVPRSMQAEISEFRELLAEADEYCRDEQLLTLAAGEQERELRNWYLGQISSQMEGDVPSPWSGGYALIED